MVLLLLMLLLLGVRAEQLRVARTWSRVGSCDERSLTQFYVMLRCRDTL